MSWSNRVRQVHRWTSAVFAALVVFITVFQAARQPPEWLYLTPLPLLGVLLLTGVPMFVQPYLAQRRRGAPARHEKPPQVPM